MQQRKAKSAALSTSRPSACSLLLHILRGTFSDGMQFPALLSIGLTFLLYREAFPFHEAIAALLVGSIIMIGLLRGCSSWQQELGDYRRQLAMQHYQQQRANDDKRHTTPGFIPFTRR
jgi:hypothetical protein